MEVTIPVGLSAEMVSDAIIGAFQQLGYSNPTASQKEAIFKRRLRFSSNRRGQKLAYCHDKARWLLLS